MEEGQVLEEKAMRCPSLLPDQYRSWRQRRPVFGLDSLPWCSWPSNPAILAMIIHINPPT